MVKFSLSIWGGLPLFNTLFRGESLNSLLRNYDYDCLSLLKETQYLHLYHFGQLPKEAIANRTVTDARERAPAAKQRSAGCIDCREMVRQFLCVLFQTY